MKWFDVGVKVAIIALLAYMCLTYNQYGRYTGFKDYSILDTKTGTIYVFGDTRNPNMPIISFGPIKH